jgi:hypothetical protein
MKKLLPFTLSAAAAATLAACGGYEPVAPAPAAVITNPSVPATVAVAPGPVVAATPSGNVTVQPPGTVIQGGTVVPHATVQGGMVLPPLRPGPARVDSITPLADTTPSGESPTMPLRRLGLRMDDGTLQFVDTRANVVQGDRVEITNDAHIRTPVAQGPTPSRY